MVVFKSSHIASLLQVQIRSRIPRLNEGGFLPSALIFENKTVAFSSANLCQSLGVDVFLGKMPIFFQPACMVLCDPGQEPIASQSNPP